MKTALLNIGNTHTTIVDDSLKNKLTVKTASDFLSELYKFDQLVIASVVPVVSGRIQRELVDRKIHFIDKKLIPEIDFNEVDSSTLGADRLANCLAGWENYGDVLIIDCGTCITAELVVGGKFLGGMIMPGRNLQSNAIHNYTGQLPLISLNDKVIDLGKNTSEALSVGIETISLKGLHSWITETILSRFKLTVCFTGGDANFFIQNARFKYVQNSDLTLIGLRIFAQKNGFI